MRDCALILLAAAGLDRLLAAPAGSRPEIIGLPPHLPLPLDRFLPAAAQGLLAIEAREGDAAVAALLAPLEHPPSRRAADAERAVLAALGADCTVPLAAHLEGDALRAWLWVDGARREAQVLVPAGAEREAGARLGASIRPSA